MRFSELFIVAQALAAGVVFASPVVKRGPCSTTSKTSTISSTSTSSSTSTKPTTASTTSTTSTTSRSSTSSTTPSSSISSSTSTSSTTTTSAAATPTYVQSASGFSYGGCVAEPFFNGVSGVRALTGSSTSSDSMTVESCATFCSGYTYFGVEYSSQCYCGNAFSSASTLDSNVADCSFTCSGSSSEYCGGSAHMNVYQLSGGSIASLPSTYVASTTSSSTSTTATATATGSGSGSGSGSATASATATASPTAVASVGGYSYVACAVEPFQNGLTTRALQAAATSNSTGMTVESCAAYCSASGYQFFGVEYSSQCYCDNSVAIGTTQDLTGGCNMACSGNSLELCGGPGRLNLYEVTGAAIVTLPTTYVVPITTTSSSSSSSSTVVPATTTSSTSSAAVTSSSSSSVTATTIVTITTKSSTTSAAPITTAVSSVTTTPCVKTTSTTSTATSTTKTPCPTSTPNCYWFLGIQWCF